MAIEDIKASITENHFTREEMRDIKWVLAGFNGERIDSTVMVQAPLWKENA